MRDNILLEAYGRYLVGFFGHYRLLENRCPKVYFEIEQRGGLSEPYMYLKGFCIHTGISICGPHPHRPYTLEEFRDELQRNEALRKEVQYGRE